MPLSDLLRESFETENLECWQRERTPTPVRAFGVRLTAAGLSIRETTAVLRLLGVDRSHGAVWQWIHRLADSLADPPTAQPSRVAVDELAVRINGGLHWLYAAIDTDFCWALSCSNSVGPTPQQRFCAPSTGNTSFQTPCFWSMATAI